MAIGDSGDEALLESLKEALKNTLDEFSIHSTFPESWRGWQMHILSGEFKNPELLKLSLILSEVATPLTTSEKMRWAFGLHFQGMSFVVTLQKFGLRLYIDTGVLATSEVAPDSLSSIIFPFVMQLKKVVSYIEKMILVPLANEQIARGDVVIRNDYYAIRNMYAYFRESALNWEELEAKVSILNMSPVLDFSVDKESIGELLRPFFEDTKRLRYKGYFEVATILSFFSLLEHILVLLKPLSPLGGDISVTQFIGFELGKKWDTIFDIRDLSVKEMRDRMLRIADKYRNFYSHGGVAKGAKSSYIYLQGFGVLQNPSPGQYHQPTFPFLDGELRDSGVQDAVFTFFDELEAWLDSGPLHQGMSYIKAPFDVPFGPEFREIFLSRSINTQEFNDWLDALSDADDRYQNFED